MDLQCAEMLFCWFGPGHALQHPDCKCEYLGTFATDRCSCNVLVFDWMDQQNAKILIFWFGFCKLQQADELI